MIRGLLTLISINLGVSCFALGTEELRKKLSEDPSIFIKAGQGLYQQKGANSCMFCHGLENGETKVEAKVADAAKLHLPKTWKIYKILGGDAAYASNKEQFLARMKEATVNLIQKGSMAHSAFKADWYDVSKAGGPYNGQMVGLSGSPSKKWVKKYQKSRGMTPEIASEAVYRYIQTLDQQNIF